MDILNNSKYSDCTLTVKNISNKYEIVIETHKLILKQLPYFDMIFKRENKKNYTVYTLFPSACEKLIKSLYAQKISGQSLYQIDTNDINEYLQKLWCSMEFSIFPTEKELIFSAYCYYTEQLDINLFASIADQLGYLENIGVIDIIKDNFESLNKSLIDSTYIQKIEEYNPQSVVSVNYEGIYVCKRQDELYREFRNSHCGNILIPIKKNIFLGTLYLYALVTDLSIKIMYKT